MTSPPHLNGFSVPEHTKRLSIEHDNLCRYGLNNGECWQLVQKVFDYLRGGTLIEITTEKFFIRAVQKEDGPHFRLLFTDKDVMAKLVLANKRLAEESEQEWKAEQEKAADVRVAQLVQRWAEKNPFSGFVMFLKGTQDFAGHMVAGGSTVVARSDVGVSEIAYYIPKLHWKRGHGTMAAAFTLQYLTALKRAHQMYIEKPICIKSHIFVEAIAVARLDNPYSIKIIEKLGMQKEGNITQFEADWGLYKLSYVSVEGSKTVAKTSSALDSKDNTSYE